MENKSIRASDIGPYVFISPAKPTYLEITLRDDGAGGVIVDKPPMDLVRGGNHVMWWIGNDTRDQHSVTLRNFRDALTNVPEWPFDEAQPPPTEIVDAGQTGRIRIKTKDRGPGGRRGFVRYAYDVVVDGVPLEPELVIEWP